MNILDCQIRKRFRLILECLSSNFFVFFVDFSESCEVFKLNEVKIADEVVSELFVGRTDTKKQCPFAAKRSLPCLEALQKR